MSKAKVHPKRLPHHHSEQKLAEELQEPARIVKVSAARGCAMQVGILCGKELLQLRHKLLDQEVDKQIKKNFRKFDMNGDGYLDQAEFRRVRRDHWPIACCWGP